ncbi:3-keto-5-aminohexanoate cleavage protein [Photobacterium makurazakiensis]|uniref:3-keto-5-aminohexanoate cleavage protein n=1 Tax=Photobacterium makurazakiensis TaxID=2910234 RepID=UPI003D0D3430
MTNHTIANPMTENQTTLNEAAIIVAPNGARKSHSDHPALPITNEEIINEVIACRDAGAAMVHLHARNNEGKHSLDISDNIKLYQSLKEKVGESIIVQLTTEAIGQYLPHQQIALVKETKPEAASFALSELIPNDSHLSDGSAFFHWVAEENIIAQYILYSAEDLQRYISFIKQGILPTYNHHLLFVLGRYSKQQVATPQDLSPYLPYLPEINTRWAVCAFGKYEHFCLTAAMLMGADIRVGFENNHLNHQGTMAQNNAAQVTHLRTTAEYLNINTLDAHSFRRILTASKSP